MEPEVLGVQQGNEGIGDGKAGTPFTPTAVGPAIEAAAEAFTGDEPVVVSDSVPATQPPEITAAFLAKLRAKYFTVRHPRVPECGHDLDQINEPRHRNCHTCWYVWFETHPQLVEIADQFYRTEGKRAIIGMRGEKFVKMFERYMKTKFDQLKEQEANGNSGEGIGGSGINANPEGEEAGTGTSTDSTQPEQSGEVQERDGDGEGTEQTVRDDSRAEAGQA